SHSDWVAQWHPPAMTIHLRILCAGTLCFVACTSEPEPEPHDPDQGENAWYFGSDAQANVWSVAIVDSAAHDEPDTLEIDELAALSGAAGNDAGPGWGDAILSSDGGRIFVNATSVDKVAVF